MKRGFSRTDMMLRDAFDVQGLEREQKRAKLSKDGTFAYNMPGFEERFGSLVKKGVLHKSFYNDPAVTAGDDTHPLRDIWSIILGFRQRLLFSEKWFEGRIQVFRSVVDEAFGNGPFSKGDIFIQKINYNPEWRIGVFQHWHTFLHEKSQAKWGLPQTLLTTQTCNYWSCASQKIHEWESYCDGMN